MKKIRLLDGSSEVVNFGTIFVPQGQSQSQVFVTNDDGGDEAMWNHDLPGRKVVRSKSGPKIVKEYIVHVPRPGDKVFYIAKKGVVVCWGLKFFYDKAEAASVFNGHCRREPNGHSRQSVKMFDQDSSHILKELPSSSTPIVEFRPGVGTVTISNSKPEGQSITDEDAARMIAQLTPGAGKRNHHRDRAQNPNQRHRRHNGLPTYVR